MADKPSKQNLKQATSEQLVKLRSLSVAELNKALIEAKSDLVKAKKMLKANELPASHVIQQMKAKVARIHSVITEQNNKKETDNE